MFRPDQQEITVRFGQEDEEEDEDTGLENKENQSHFFLFKNQDYPPEK